MILTTIKNIALYILQQLVVIASIIALTLIALWALNVPVDISYWRLMAGILCIFSAFDMFKELALYGNHKPKEPKGE